MGAWRVRGGSVRRTRAQGAAPRGDEGVARCTTAGTRWAHAFVLEDPTGRCASRTCAAAGVSSAGARRRERRAFQLGVLAAVPGRERHRVAELHRRRDHRVRGRRDLRRVRPTALSSAARPSGGRVGAPRIKAILDNLRRYLSVGDAEIVPIDLAHEIDRCQGNQSQATKLLGMPRRTLVERLRGYGMTRRPRE